MIQPFAETSCNCTNSLLRISGYGILNGAYAISREINDKNI